MRQAPSRVIFSASFGAALILTAMVAALPGRSWARLTPEAMAQSRGGDQGFQKGVFLCASLTQLTPCNGPGPCQTCYNPGYNDTGTQSGNYDPNMAEMQECGNIYNGVCQQIGTWRCTFNTIGDTGNPCADPPSSPNPQN